MKIFKLTEASKYLGVSSNTLKKLADNDKINSFKTDGGHRCFTKNDLDFYMKKESISIDEILDISDNLLFRSNILDLFQGSSKKILKLQEKVIKQENIINEHREKILLLNEAVQLLQELIDKVDAKVDTTAKYITNQSK